MKKCVDCYHYEMEHCFHQNRSRPPGYGCSKWRGKQSWFTILAQYLTDFWYDHIRSLFRR